MSMLAERRVKQKWSLNPRGKAWSEDANKFGQKMLERMGWAPGKGLGAKEDGIKEHVKVSHKADSKGVGYKETNDQWTEHDSNFNSLLQSLSGNGNTGEVKFSSLEQKSQSSRARVHYKKFTRGKDLSRCSEKDLANIFGKRSLKQTPKVEEEVEAKSESFGVNGGSMLDYFKNKLPKFKKSYVVGSNGVLKKESDSEDEGYSGFGFKRKKEWEVEAAVKKVKIEENGFCNRGFDPLSSSAVEVKKHCLKTIEEEDEVIVIEEDSQENSSTVNSEDVVKKEKKKRKKAKFSNNKEELSVENSTFHEFSIEEDVVDSNFEAKHKKKQKDSSSIASVKTKEKKNEEISIDNPTFNESSTREDFVDSNYEVKRNKKKKKEKSIDNLVFNESAVTESFEVKKKKKNEELSMDNSTYEGFEVKRKKKKIEERSIDNPAFNESPVTESFEVKKKKKNEELSMNNSAYENFEVKRKKKKIEEKSIDNPVFNDFEVKKKNKNEELSMDNSTYESFEVKRKKKKIEEKSIDNPVFNDFEVKKNKNEELSMDNAAYENFEVKRKKKKIEEKSIDNPVFNESVTESLEVIRKKKNEEPSLGNSTYEESFEVKRKRRKNEVSIDNPTFNESSLTEDFVDSNYEVKRKQKKKNGKLTLDNPTFDESSVKEDFVDGSYEVKRKKKKSDERNEESVDSLKQKEENETFDLMLNITSTPSQPKANSTTITSAKSSAKRRKSVRFSDVNEERIIPNKAEQDELFQINERVINSSLNDRNVEAISRKIDGFQMEIENDINEAKAVNYVGEVGDPNGENEKLSTGTKLKFKYAKFGRSVAWMERKGSSSKSSYKHLIKGDIIVGFRNTNLHEIGGYAVRSE